MLHSIKVSRKLYFLCPFQLKWAQKWMNLFSSHGDRQLLPVTSPRALHWTFFPSVRSRILLSFSRWRPAAARLLHHHTTVLLPIKQNEQTLEWKHKWYFSVKNSLDSHICGLADRDGKIISFAFSALQRHSLLFCLLPVLFHLLNVTEAWFPGSVSELYTWASPPAPHLVPLHQRLILPAESLDLLIQFQISLLIPLRHHGTGGLSRHIQSLVTDSCLIKQSISCL